MRLSKVIASSNELTLRGDDIDITGMTADSRKVQPGFLFIAIPGTQNDGRAFIDEALKRGAVAVMAPTDTPCPAPLIEAADIRKALSSIAATFYPRQPETITAVTGTSGKTSTAQFTRELWQALGQKSASIGTLGLVVGGETHYGSLTTPDAITLHQLLDDCATKGVTHLAVEASSHGLDMHRLDGVRIKAAGFTNLSRDHLDYHPTMEAYLAAKLRLFTEVAPFGALAILNADIPEFAALNSKAAAHGMKVLSYGKQGKDLKLIDTQPQAKGQRLMLEVMGKSITVMLPVLGSFQIFNALCALGMVIGSGSDAVQATGALEKLSGVPGRLQLAGTSKSGGVVFVDYAHKPDALENVLKALRPHVAAHPGAKLGVIFGCGGNRDKGKRPLMGAIAGKLADWAIVTDDNPRKEDPTTIRKEILGGFTDLHAPTEIGDRAAAIAEGIGRLHKDDVLIIAGKGHEPGQIVGDTILPFEDAEVARKVLAQ